MGGGNMKQDINHFIKAYARTHGLDPRKVRKDLNALPTPQRKKSIATIRAGMFSEELKRWRGERLQKEAADLLDVSLSTYHNWEQGVNTPSRFTIRALRTAMAENRE